MAKVPNIILPEATRAFNTIGHFGLYEREQFPNSEFRLIDIHQIVYTQSGPFLRAKTDFQIPTGLDEFGYPIINNVTAELIGPGELLNPDNILLALAGQVLMTSCIERQHSEAVSIEQFIDENFSLQTNKIITPKRNGFQTMFTSAPPPPKRKTPPVYAYTLKPSKARVEEITGHDVYQISMKGFPIGGMYSSATIKLIENLEKNITLMTADARVHSSPKPPTNNKNDFTLRTIVPFPFVQDQNGLGASIARLYGTTALQIRAGMYNEAKSLLEVISGYDILAPDHQWVVEAIQNTQQHQ